MAFAAQLGIHLRALGPLGLSAAQKGGSQQQSGFGQRQSSEPELEREQCGAHEWRIAERRPERHMKRSFLVLLVPTRIQHFLKDSIYCGTQARQVRDDDSDLRFGIVFQLAPGPCGCRTNLGP